MPNKIEIHFQLCMDIHELYERKNADYGDSFAKVREEIPNAILVRLSDKLNRLKTLMNSEEEYCVKDESIDDTLMDLANYCLLELTERKAKKEENEVHVPNFIRGQKWGDRKKDAEDSWEYAARVAEEIDEEKKKLQHMELESVTIHPHYVLGRDTKVTAQYVSFIPTDQNPVDYRNAIPERIEVIKHD